MRAWRGVLLNISWRCINQIIQTKLGLVFKPANSLSRMLRIVGGNTITSHLLLVSCSKSSTVCQSSVQDTFTVS